MVSLVDLRKHYEDLGRRLAYTMAGAPEIVPEQFEKDFFTGLWSICPRREENEKPAFYGVSGDGGVACFGEQSMIEKSIIERLNEIPDEDLDRA